MKVALIGLGLMGEPMAAHLLDARHDVVVVAHRSRAAIERIIARGAREAGSISEAAATTEVALMLLPTSNEVEAVLFGESGIAAGMAPGYLAVDMGTCYPLDTRRLARRFHEAGGRFIDAPVTGGVEGARAGTLTVMGGGDPDILDGIRPLLAPFSSNVYHFGDIGAGHAAKLIQNMIGWIEVAGVAEGIALAKATGLDLETFFKMLSTSHSNSPIVQWMVPKVFAGAFDDVEFRLELAHKDIHQAAKLARETTHLPLTVANAATELFQLARAMGFGDQDSTAVIRGLETMLDEPARVPSKR
ncbi:MAG: NAD(P)-dependent oxidoreductase [Parvibaculaceae bacterium]